MYGQRGMSDQAKLQDFPFTEAHYLDIVRGHLKCY